MGPTPLLFAALLSLRPQAAAPARQPPGIVAAEWAFIQHCQRAGIKAAFLEAFAPDGLIFRPEPSNGREWYRQQLESPARLAWFPAVSFTAASRDLGYNTGPWTWSPDAEGEPRAQGWFFSVWKRDRSGAWKLFWDIGIPTREAAAGVAALKVSKPPATVAALVPLSESQALELDRRFAAKAKAEGVEHAYRAYLAPDGRVFRSPAQPALGWKAAETLLKASPGVRSWEPRGVAVARSGEILFVQGGYSRAVEGKPAETGSYVRVWRRLGTAWTLELDLESPQR